MPRVLVADDDLDFLDVVAMAAEYVHLEVIRATTGHELLAALTEDGPFDAILTDIAMPCMTGIQVIHAARRAGWHQPVVMMSGHYDPVTLSRIAELGGHVSFLLKPFTLRELYAALRAALRPVPPDETTMESAVQATRLRAI